MLQICIWNVDTGQVEGKISHSGEDQLTSVSWSPDGAKISCGGKSGQFYQCDTKGVVLDSWEGIRVVGLHYRRDGKSVLAADTHHRIRSYNFDELSDASVSLCGAGAPHLKNSFAPSQLNDVPLPGSS